METVTTKAAMEFGRGDIRTRWILGFVAVVIFGIGNYVVDISPSARRIWADIWWSGSSFVALIACYNVGRALDGHLKKAWRCFGHACLFWFVGILGWSYLELIEGVIAPFPAWSDMAFLSFPLLFMAGIINYHANVPSAPFRFMQFTKLAIILCCIVIIYVVIFEEAIKLNHHPLLYLITAMAYPVLYVSMLVLGIVNAAFYTWGGLRSTTLILTLSVAIAAYCHSFYGYALISTHYEVGNALDIFWVIAFILIALAANMQRQYVRKAKNNIGPEIKDDLVLAEFHWVEELIAPVALLATLIILFLFQENFDEVISDYLFFLGLLLIVFLAIREILSKKIENELIETIRKSESKYKDILDNMHDTYYRTDAAGKTVMVSPSVEKLLGYSPEELVGSSLENLYVHPEKRRQFLSAIHDQGGSVSNYEAELKRKDNSIVWVSTNARILKDSQGGILGIEGTTRDVTERKTIEENLRKAHQELELRVQERTADLEKSREVAEKSSNAKSEFLSRMSHELRTPLNAILGFAQLLEVDIKINDRDQRSNIQDIITSGYYLLDLINEILDLSQIESGTLPFDSGEVDASQVIEQCLSMVRPIADVNKVSLQYKSPDVVLPRIYCDPIRLRQALINVISNGVKYNKAGGSVFIWCEVFGAVSGEGGSNRLRINIQDTGCGIPELQREKLFMPFERLGAGRSGVHGTGIGLSISLRLIEMMEGRLELQTTSDEGSHFCIELPLASGTR